MDIEDYLDRVGVQHYKKSTLEEILKDTQEEFFVIPANFVERGMTFVRGAENVLDVYRCNQKGEFVLFFDDGKKSSTLKVEKGEFFISPSRVKCNFHFLTKVTQLYFIGNRVGDLVLLYTNTSLSLVDRNLLSGSGIEKLLRLLETASEDFILSSGDRKIAYLSLPELDLKKLETTIQLLLLLSGDNFSINSGNPKREKYISFLLENEDILSFLEIDLLGIISLRTVKKVIQSGGKKNKIEYEFSLLRRKMVYFLKRNLFPSGEENYEISNFLRKINYTFILFGLSDRTHLKILHNNSDVGEDDLREKEELILSALSEEKNMLSPDLRILLTF